MKYFIQMTRRNDMKYIPALGYKWLTKFYDFGVMLIMPEKKIRNKLIDDLNPQKGEKILEFGFGTGQNLVLGKKKSLNAEFIGLDIDPKVKRIAEQKIKSKNLEIRLVLYDGNRFPFKDNEFDKVFSSLVFHHLDATTKAHCMHEIYRVLRHNGNLIIGDWGKPKTKLRRILFYLVQILDGFKTTQENVEGKIPKYMENSGFKDVEEVGFVNTVIGIFCYYKGRKPAHNTVYKT